MRIYHFLFLLSLFIFPGCDSGGAQLPVEVGQAARSVPVVQPFEEAGGGLSDYWYQGEAEITRYELQQNRYGGIHPGEAIMIFVTEDFLTDKQVKNDFYRNPNSVPILKNNMIRKFTTGIYDYSMMTSVFTPVEAAAYPMTLKVSTSSQEWCGHTYMQVNWREDTYLMTLHSYFENEADQKKEAPHAILEDELFNRIRLNPEGLPTGELSILPGTMYLRLTHSDFTPTKADATLGDYTGSDFEGESLRAYRLSYPGLNRTVEIVFEKEAPYRIVGWTDAHPSLFDEKVRTTVARATRTIKSAYWEQNSPEDVRLREELRME